MRIWALSIAVQSGGDDFAVVLVNQPTMKAYLTASKQFGRAPQVIREAGRPVLRLVRPRAKRAHQFLARDAAPHCGADYIHCGREPRLEAAHITTPR